MIDFIRDFEKTFQTYQVFGTLPLISLSVLMDGGVTFFNRVTLFGILGVQGLFFLYLSYAVFISKASSRQGMGTKLRVVLTIVAILFALLWGLVAFVNLLNLDRDTLAPEWI